MSDEEPDDDEASSSEPPQPRRIAALKISVSPWLLVALVVGLMLEVRLEMTTDYVARGRLEGTAILAALLFSVVAALRVVNAQVPEDGAPPPSGRVTFFRFGFVFLLALPIMIPAALGILALVNRVGRMDDVVHVRCTTTRLESRVRIGAGRRAIVHYTCTMPDGQHLKGHAPERMPAEPGKPLVIASSRGRLGVWLRHGSPDPIAEEVAAP